jgi:hypothetical protein
LKNTIEITASYHEFSVTKKVTFNIHDIFYSSLYTLNEAGNEIVSLRPDFDDVLKQNSGELIIPKYINGKIIDSLSENLFMDDIYLKSVILPSSIKTVGKKAFFGCENLTNLEVNSNVNFLESSLSTFSILKIDLEYKDSIIFFNKFNTALSGYSDTDKVAIPHTFFCFFDMNFHFHPLDQILPPFTGANPY